MKGYQRVSTEETVLNFWVDEMTLPVMSVSLSPLAIPVFAEQVHEQGAWWQCGGWEWA